MRTVLQLYIYFYHFRDVLDEILDFESVSDGVFLPILVFILLILSFLPKNLNNQGPVVQSIVS